MVAPTAKDRRYPEPRPDFESGEDPAWIPLRAAECPDLVRLHFCHLEMSESTVIEPSRCSSGLLQPPGDRAPRAAADSSNRRDADALDAQVSHSVKQISGCVEVVIWGVGVARERLAAGLASIPASSATLHREVRVPDDVALPDDPMVITRLIRAGLPRSRVGRRPLPHPLGVDPILVCDYTWIQLSNSG